MSTVATEWNPRFVAFAASKGYTPEALPRIRSTNADFMCWISAQKRAFKLASPAAFLGDTIVDHDAFTEFCHQSAAVRQAA